MTLTCLVNKVELQLGGQVVKGASEQKGGAESRNIVFLSDIVVRKKLLSFALHFIFR